MKKILTIGSLCIMSCFLLTGCGTNQDAAITNLANQIDLLNNTVDAVSRVEQDIPSTSSLTSQQAINYSGIYQSAKEVLKNQNNYKTTILSKNSIIKNKIASGLKLNKQNCKAINDLTSTLSKDTKKLNETKADFKNSINEVKKISSNEKATTSQISAKINKLSNCIDSQQCYYKNIINTLNNIEKILEIDDKSFDYSLINTEKINNYSSLNNEEKKENDSNNFQELYYQYLLTEKLNKDCENCDTNQKDNEKEKNIYLNQNPSYYTNNLNNRPFYNGYANNGMYGYYYGYGYGPMTNPTRNTDSFRPWVYNIDTYRLPINRFKGNTIYPIQNTLPQEIPVTSENKNDEIKNETSSNKNVVKEDTTKSIENNKNEIEHTVKQEESLNLKNDNNKMVNEKTYKLDINKEIEKLINSKEAFNKSNFIILR